MFTPMSRGGLGVIKRTQTNPSPTTPIKLHVFDQPGFSLRATTVIKRGPYTWSLTPLLHEKDGRTAVDILVKVLGIPADQYLRCQFAFQQPGNVKQTFEFTFDSVRNSYFYRRALTIARVTNLEGNVGCHYTHYRFLRSRDDDEPLEMIDDGRPAWKPVLPLVWERRNGVWRWKDNNDTFQGDIDELEHGKNHFMYYFFIEHMLPLDEPPERDPQFWPKHCLTARWKRGREISVDANYFSPTWTKFRDFMKNLRMLEPSDFDDLVDVLGHYYHAWEFNDERLMELVRAAEKFGFFDFPQYLHTRGNFRSFANSIKSVLIVPEIKRSKDDALMESRASAETNKFTTRAIRHFSEDHTPPFHIFRAANESTWTVSYEVNTFNDVDYFSVYVMMNARFEPGEVQMWNVEIGPQRKSSKLPPRSFVRLFNSVQRTVGFPVCYYWKDVKEAIGKAKGLEMTLTLTRSGFAGYAVYDLVNAEPATGVMKGEIWTKNGGKTPINRDLLLESCGIPFTSSPEHPERWLNSLNHEELVHFLDHLYHGSKVYSTTLWPKVANMIRAVDCDALYEALQRMLIRHHKSPRHKLILEAFHHSDMEILDFYLDNYEALSIENVDTYLKANPEMPVTHNQKKYHVVELVKK